MVTLVTGAGEYCVVPKVAPLDGLLVRLPSARRSVIGVARAGLSMHRDRAEVGVLGCGARDGRRADHERSRCRSLSVRFWMASGRVTVRGVDAHGVGAERVSARGSGQETLAGERDPRGQGGRCTAANAVLEKVGVETRRRTPGSCRRCREEAHRGRARDRRSLLGRARTGRSLAVAPGPGPAVVAGGLSG